MILRPFVPDDWPVLSLHLYPAMPETGLYDGKRFEQLAIEVSGLVVGYVSLLEQTEGIVSEGIEIIPDQRRKGAASQALRLLLPYARDLGYHTMIAQVRQDNVASLALHKKLGFQISEQFVNKRGNPVYTVSLDIN